MIAAAGRPNLSLADVDALENAYWPWAGALHSLLDSLADEAEDHHTGQRSLLDYYDRSEIAKRLALVAGHTRQSLRAFSRPVEQMLILTSMVAFYSSDPHASATLSNNLSRKLGAMLGGPTCQGRLRIDPVAPVEN